MKKIYSKIKPDTLLHLVHRLDEIEGRTNVAPENEFIQLATLKMEKGTTFRPHKHIWKDGEDKVIAQESWVVMSGRVQAIFYDLDDTVVEKRILETGDLSITLFGGHNYVILEDNTLVLEYKTGPYYGQASDKEFIND